MKKNIIGFIFLVVCMLMSTVYVCAEENNVDIFRAVEKGDTTKDGTLSLRDALTALKYVAKISEPESDDVNRADIDRNSVVDITDAKIIFDTVLEGKHFGYEYLGDEEGIILVDSNCHYSDNEDMYTCLTDVVKYLNANPPKSEEERVTVYFAPAVYREHTELTAPYVTYKSMFPESEEPVNITFYYGCGKCYYSLNSSSAGSNNGASTVINKSAHDFIAENIMFENSYNIYMTEEELTDWCAYPVNKDQVTQRAQADFIRKSTYQTQALALKVDADRCKFINCDIISRQDTLLMNGHGNRVYFENCFIEGTVDFIYGNGTAVFESCTINSPYHSGHVTAGSHEDDITYGFLFKDCELTRIATTPSVAPEDASYSLGRPWHNRAMVCYYNCKMDKHIYEGISYHTSTDDGGNEIITGIEDGRWRPMGDGELIDSSNSRFSEVGTMDIEGNPIELTREICPEFEEILQQSDMDVTGKNAPYKWLKGNDGWNPGEYPTE